MFLKLLTFFILALPFSRSYSQNEEMVEYKRDFILFEGCDIEKHLERCFEKKFQDFITKNIKEEDIETIIESSKKDTILFYSNLFIDKKGKLVKNKSFLSVVYEEEKALSLMYILKKLPEIKPPLDKFNNKVSIELDNIFGFKINRLKKRIHPIYGFKSIEAPLNFLDRLPLYDGCSENLTNEETRQCISNKISELFSNHFDLDILYDSKLPNGLVKIYLDFKVGKNGEIKNIKTNVTDSRVKKETIRVIKLIPKFIKSGIYKEEEVVVSFSLPILLSLER
ncbi:hypothetical protein E1J38_009625 [Seonamhaeicola sediminis]|uniref:TonB C-terminal domain-containing protein n=1 Tax=Seonamhaeicola sediminis TaxID=2528206 RepID=A0A562YD76_9FLAO|nr:hypothetical protein [Seonamhaeicola sediminis]TWO32082.1 hypothetical protein E1J38_009625 [Seonamhaeicola sediminis]